MGLGGAKFRTWSGPGGSSHKGPLASAHAYPGRFSPRFALLRTAGQLDTAGEPGGTTGPCALPSRTLRTLSRAAGLSHLPGSPLADFARPASRVQPAASGRELDLRQGRQPLTCRLCASLVEGVELAMLSLQLLIAGGKGSWISFNSCLTC